MSEEVKEAEHEIYSEDIEIALKENEEAKKLLRQEFASKPKKDHHDSPERYISHNGLEQFRETLNSYEVDGLSFGMKIPAMEETLVSRGYKRTRHKIAKARGRRSKGGPVYEYKRTDGDKIDKVKILGEGFEGIVKKLVITLNNSEGESATSEAKIRLLDAFSGTCYSGTRNVMIECIKYTKTNKVSIAVKSIREGIEYTIFDVPSYAAKESWN